MGRLWRSARWAGGKLLFLATLLLATLLLLLIPSIIRYVPNPIYPTRPLIAVDWGLYVEQVGFHLSHVLHGHLAPTGLERAQASLWYRLPAELTTSLAVTLRLVGMAFAAAVLLGIPAGWAMSRLGPRRTGRALWGFMALLQCFPDLLLATALDLALVLVGIALDVRLYGTGAKFYYHNIAPVVALALLAMPYVARVTAAAIEDASSQLYVRTAVSKGLHPGAVLFKHLGKNVLIQLWTALPIVTAILISGSVVVEYFMEIHGLGRNLMLSLGSQRHVFDWGQDRYVGVYFLIPLLVLFTLISALSEAGLRWFDPRVRDRGLAETNKATSRAITKEHRLHMPHLPRLGDLGAALKQAGAEAVSDTIEWVRRTPEHLREVRKALKDPVLLAGVIMVTGVVLVAIFAPQLAPYSPDVQFKPYQDASGHLWIPPFGPSPDHKLGTDMMGRDFLSLLIYGTRYALLFACLIVPARFVGALLLGSLAARRGGIWERLVNWLGILFTAVPQPIIPLAIIPTVNLIYAKNPAGGLAWGVLLVALPGIPRLARAVQQQVESLLARPFLEGAEAVGAGPGRVLRKYILPHMAPQLITMLVLEIPMVLTLTALLSYFAASPGGSLSTDDMGSIPIIFDWGSLMQPPLMLIMTGQNWLWAPFGCLFVAILAFTLLGEGLRRHWANIVTEWQWQ